MEMFQQATAGVVVLAILVGALWFLKARLRLPLTRGPGKHSALQCIDRVALTPQHSLHLVRVGRKTLLVGVSPGALNLIHEAEDGVELRREEAR